MDDLKVADKIRTPSFEELVNLLESLVKVYRTLLDVVRKEKEILVSADLDDLNENNRTKEKVLLKARSLESQRVKVAADLGASLNLTKENSRLLEMARQLPREDGDRLRSLHSVLELLLRRVQDYNKENDILVKSALNNITGAMKAIRDSLKDKPTYKRKGAVSDKPVESGQLVRREI